MAKNVYEGMFILDSNHFGRDPEGVSRQISDLIQKAGGEILVSRLWEERRLAYAIKGHRKGTYWLTYFRLESGQLTGLRRQCQLNENILRMLFLKVEPRIVDALVAHALAGPASAQRPEPEAPALEEKVAETVAVGEREGLEAAETDKK